VHTSASKGARLSKGYSLLLLLLLQVRVRPKHVQHRIASSSLRTSSTFVMPTKAWTMKHSGISFPRWTPKVWKVGAKVMPSKRKPTFGNTIEREEVHQICINVSRSQQVRDTAHSMHCSMTRDYGDGQGSLSLALKDDSL